MLFEPDRHEPLQATAWDQGRALDCIARIVADTERAFSPTAWWPTHPRDTAEAGDATQYCLYFGAAGVVWALHYLQAAGAVALERELPDLAPTIEPNRAAMQAPLDEELGSYLMGDTGIWLVQHAVRPSPALAYRLERLIRATIDHPCRELMWGSPGTLLAAHFLHRHSGDARWAELFRATARRLREQLEWSAGHDVHCWTQDLYGGRYRYLDAVHGFVATAAVLISGRDLLDDRDAWAACIANTVRRSAERDGALVNWRALLDETPARAKRLVQFCHGAPGFVICLADFPDASLDDLLLAGGETTWRAGPLRKGANLCHGTAGNGYALLKLYRRFADPLWLDRARAFAMHAIRQAEAERERYGRWHYSLWTGDLGLAVYLLHCVRAEDRFPTLDVFFADRRGEPRECSS